MRLLFSGCFILLQLLVVGQNKMTSKVYPWNENEATKTNWGSRFLLFQGAGEVLSKQVLKGVIIKGGKKITYRESNTGDELFFIIKEGPIAVTLNKVTTVLDKGYVVFVLTGDEVQLYNAKKDDVSFYEMQMVSNQKPDRARGLNAGNSFFLNWYDMVYKATDKGGVRQLFSRATSMSSKFDIHITSLNPGLSSHLPHTHKNEEIILMIDGNGEMQFGEVKQKIETGGAAWVESMIPHNFTNLGNRPATYFAIQWN